MNPQHDLGAPPLPLSCRFIETSKWYLACSDKLYAQSSLAKMLLENRLPCGRQQRYATRANIGTKHRPSDLPLIVAGQIGSATRTRPQAHPTRIQHVHALASRSSLAPFYPPLAPTKGTSNKGSKGCHGYGRWPN